MSFYEHTFVGKQDVSEKDVNNIIDTCSQIIKKSGKLLKTEKWGLLNLSPDLSIQPILFAGDPATRE